jgi:hypothetical protein
MVGVRAVHVSEETVEAVRDFGHEHRSAAKIQVIDY